MGIVRICCLLAVLIWTNSAIPQSYFPIVQKNGIWFHEVSIREGMTLFSIAQDLNATSTQIKTDNPGLTDNIQIGSKIFVRAVRSTFNYNAIKGDTPYGIAKKFGLILDSLMVSNPSLKNGVNVNQLVNIKNGIKRYVDVSVDSEESTSTTLTDSTERNYRTFEFSDSVINYVVKPGEKLSEIAKRYLLNSATLKAYNNLSSNTIKAGTVLKIPLRKTVASVSINSIPEKINDIPKKVTVRTNDVFVPVKTTKTLRIGVFLPFNRDSLIFPLKGMQKFAFDFYMGTLAAIDSLSLESIKGDVYYFDYRSKEDRIDALITAGKLDRFDMFIGPLHAPEAEKLAQFAQTKRIPLVLPLPTMTTSMQQNEFVFCVATELNTQATLMAQHLASDNPSTSIVLYKSTLQSDTLIEQFFLIEYYANSPKNARIIIANETTAKAFLKSNTPITIICFSQDKKQVLSLVKNGVANPNVELYGPREWTDWKEINSNIDNPSSFKYFSTTCFDLDQSRTKTFHKAFRVRFETDLTKAVLLGYDIMYSLIPWYFNGDSHKFGLMTGFQYGKTVSRYHVNFGGKVCQFSNFKSVVDVER